MEIQSTFRNCENNQQLYDCLQDALETPFFLAHIDNVKAAIEVDERSGTQVIKCTLSLVVQNNGVIGVIGLFSSCNQCRGKAWRANVTTHPSSGSTGRQPHDIVVDQHVVFDDEPRHLSSQRFINRRFISRWALEAGG